MEQQNSPQPPVIPDQPKKKKGCLKMGLIAFGIFIAVSVLIGIFTDKEIDKVAEADEKIAMADEQIAGELSKEPTLTQEQKDSIEAENKQRIAKLAPLFSENTDEFKHTTWVHLKSEPKYRNTNAVYMYFQMKDDKATNLRLVLQYVAEDWLFIKNVVFLINGWDFTYNNLNFERDNSGYEIWEWADLSVSDPVLVAAIQNADTFKIRYEGSQYTKDIELTKKQIQSLKDVIEYYKLLGGKI